MSGTTYTLIVVNDIDGPANPERYELEVSKDDEMTPILRYSQDNIGTSFTDLFIDLSTLIRLGDLARAIRDNDGPIPADAVESW
jgi:hypothetical protein